MSDSRERRERSKLWLIEHVVEFRRSTTERTGRAVRTVVPEQLKERVVGDIQPTESFRRGTNEVSSHHSVMNGNMLCKNGMSGIELIGRFAYLKFTSALIAS